MINILPRDYIDPYTTLLFVGYFSCPGSVIKILLAFQVILKNIKLNKSLHAVLLSDKVQVKIDRQDLCKISTTCAQTLSSASLFYPNTKQEQKILHYIYNIIIAVNY